jgi:hypothetical protein
VDRSSELRLPTIAVPVRLAIVGHDVTGAELFVADVTRRGRGELIDDLADALDDATSFVPVRVGGVVRLFAKQAIAWVAIARRDPDFRPSTDFPEEPSEVIMLYDRKHRVELELAHGARIHGTLLDSSPADRPRVIDHLNRSGRFVRVWTQTDHMLINHHQIIAVAEAPEVE